MAIFHRNMGSKPWHLPLQSLTSTERSLAEDIASECCPRPASPTVPAVGRFSRGTLGSGWSGTGAVCGLEGIGGTSLIMYGKSN